MVSGRGSVTRNGRIWGGLVVYSACQSSTGESSGSERPGGTAQIEAPHQLVTNRWPLNLEGVDGSVTQRAVENQPVVTLETVLLGANTTLMRFERAG